MGKIKVYNLSKLQTADFELFQELQGDFKITTPEKIDKLKTRIVNAGFKYAFQVWKDTEGLLWIIDAHHRRRALKELHDEGYEIPEIPYLLIQARDKKEAVQEIAFANSHYSEINPEATIFEEYEITEDDLELAELGNFNFSNNLSNSLEVHGDDSGNSKGLDRLTFAGKVVFMTEDEKEALLEVYNNYLNEAATNYGFVNHLLSLE